MQVRATVVVAAALLLATPAALASPAQAAPWVARDPAVITNWDAVAVRTIIAQGLKPPPVAQLYLGFVSAAMYNAVVTIDGRFQPYAFWRPSTAIQLANTDHNPATTADPTWTPLFVNPPYPDYPSGHACLSGATTNGLAHLFGARHIDLAVSSAVTGTTRH